MSRRSQRRQLTDEEIRAIFTLDPTDMDEEPEPVAGDDSSDEELPENLTALEDEVLEDGEEFDWRGGDFRPNVMNFSRSVSGVRKQPDNTTELGCFKMFLSESTANTIVAETNAYAQTLREQFNSAGKLAKWVDTTVGELYVFLAVLFTMGLVKKNNVRDYWTTNPLLSTPFFGTVFSQDRFLLLLRCLHFTSTTSADPLQKIRSVLAPIVQSFNQIFYPYQDLCIDESMVKWKGRLSFKQYIPSKRHRFGIKLFVLCDVMTGYVQDLIIYTGKSTDITMVHGVGMSGSVVMSLMRPFLGKGHILYVDNWYSSPTLYAHLLRHQTGACGTVRSNRKGMPKFRQKMSKGEVEHFNNNKMLATKWHDKRDVHVLSTVHSGNMVPTGKVDYATGESITKPLCVVEYNKKMGSVDNLDKRNTFVDSARKTFKWYKKLFFYVLDVAVFNSYVVHKQITAQDLTYPQFRENLACQLLEEFHTTRRPSSGGRPSLDNPIRLSARHFPSLVTQTPQQGDRTRRRCRVCQTTTRRPQARKATKYMCVPCDVALCVTPCFEEYHSLKHF